MIIYSGKGVGMYAAGVTPDGMLEVCAVVRSIDLFCNQVKGDTYSILIQQTPTGPGDCFFYGKNLAEHDIIVSSIKLQCASNEDIELHLGDLGAPVGGVDCALVNRQAGCGRVAEVLCKVGNDLTGLSGGAVVERLVVKGGDPSKRFGWLSGIVIPKNHVLTMYAVTGTAVIKATISMHFCECV